METFMSCFYLTPDANYWPSNRQISQKGSSGNFPDTFQTGSERNTRELS